MPFLCLFDRCGKNRLTESVAGGVNLFFSNELRSSEHNPRGAGGALLDVGIYGINFALMHFGRDIERIESSIRRRLFIDLSKTFQYEFVCETACIHMKLAI